MHDTHEASHWPIYGTDRHGVKHVIGSAVQCPTCGLCAGFAPPGDTVRLHNQHVARIGRDNPKE